MSIWRLFDTYANNGNESGIDSKSLRFSLRLFSQAIHHASVRKFMHDSNQELYVYFTRLNLKYEKSLLSASSEIREFISS